MDYWDKVNAEESTREAAPDLLAALEMADHFLTDHTECSRPDGCSVSTHQVNHNLCRRCRIIVITRAAIAKARGEG